MSFPRFKRISRGALVGATLAASLILSVNPARAIELNLLAGGSGMINGAYFTTTDPQLDSSSTLSPFVRLNQNGSESGYNADARPVMPNVNPAASLTHDVQLPQVSIIADPGAGASGSYYEFLLKINDGGTGANITLHTLQLYTSAIPLASAATLADLTGSGAALNYDLDLGSDSRIHLDGALTSGPANLFVYVPVSAFANASAQSYLYLYSGFGAEAGGSGTYYVANGGMETWGVRSPVSVAAAATVPENATTVALLGGALLALGSFRRWATRKPAQK